MRSPRRCTAGGPLVRLRTGAAHLVRQRIATEAPDRMNWCLASIICLALAAVGLSVVPLLADGPLVATPVGIVVWGSCEALTIIAVFLHGWPPNSPFPLIDAYRYAAIVLPMMLPSMFVLIWPLFWRR